MRSSPWPTTRRDGKALALCFHGDNISEGDSFLVIKNTPEMALPRVETENSILVPNSSRRRLRHLRP
jgi:hypothetical protein